MHGGIEMKRLLIAFFMMFAVHTAYAENYIVFKSDVVEKAINQLVASENRQSAADEYQKNMDQTNGKISVTGLYKVCIASGFNIQTTDGYNLCRNFLNFMISESDFGTGSVTQQSCINTLNGVWTLSSDGKKYQCVGRDGNLLNYRKSCRDGGGTCIKQFDNLKTQGAKGREFINAYGTLKGLNFTCHANADISKLGQDYIMCSAGGNAYEFEFDSLNQSPDSTSSNSENTAICELYGGKIVNTGDKYTEDTWQSCDISSELCKGAVSSLAQRTGHSVQYQGYCRLSRGIKEVSTIFLNQIDGIDSRIFYNAGLQMRMDTAKPMVEEYLRTKFPNESYIVCGATPKILNEGLGIDKDYVISCTVGSQQVDFIFDDLSETFDNDAATGKEAMQCIINGGTFKGETCRGPTKEECEKLDAVLRSKGSDKGARYDDEARACILGNAESTYKRDVTVGYITGAVVIVGGAVVTIVTGGATAPVVINGAVMLATDIGINYVMDANHQRLTNKATKKFVNFVTDADACTTEQCALDVLEKHYATLSGVMSDLNTDDQAVVDATMDRLIGLIQTDFVACGEDDNGTVIYASPADCAIQSSHLTVLDYIDPYSEIALVIGSVIFDPGYVVARFTKLNKVTKVADKITDVVDGVKASTRATSKVDAAADAMKNVDVAKLKSQVLDGINPDVVKGTGVDAGDLEFQIEVTIDDFYSARFGTRALEKGEKMPSQGLLPDVSTVINKKYASDKNILFLDPTVDNYIDNVIEQIDAGANNKKMITSVIDMTTPEANNQMKRVIQTLDDADVDKAVIPFSGNGHQMTLFKEGDTWTILDQYDISTSDFVDTKKKVIDILDSNIPETSKIIVNKGDVCKNETGTCALFSHAIGRQVLEDQVNIAQEIEYLNLANVPMNQNIVDKLIDEADRDIGITLIDMLNSE